MKKEINVNLNLSEEFDELKAQIPAIIKSSIQEALEEHLQASKERPLTTTEIAQELKVSRITINNWVKAGHIPSKVIGGRRYFILSEVMKYAPNPKRKKITTF